MSYRFWLILLLASALVSGCSSKPEKKRSSRESKSADGESGSGDAPAGTDGLSVVSRRPGLVGNAEKAKLLIEIDQLSQSLYAYKERHGNQYPPCLADATVANRKVRFMRHVQAAFANSSYGTAAANFDKLANGLKLGNNSTYTLQAYNFKNAAGDLAPLDLNTLDQAESIVFWLGGFPTPYSIRDAKPVTDRKLFGFHRDADAPLKRDTLAQEGPDPMRYRTDLLFNFRENQLVDQDHDGWWEYVPFNPETGEVAAPFVYFDADTYTTTGTLTGTATNIQCYGYPRPDNPGSDTLAYLFGLTAPLAEYIDPTNVAPMRWQNPESFQIISAGLDGRFSESFTGDLATAMRIPVYPQGDVYRRANNFSEASPYDDEELDNLTNFSRTTLGEAR